MITYDERSVTKPIRVIVADDHQVVLMAVQHLLEKEGHIKIVALVNSVSALKTSLREQGCDVLISDYAFNNSSQQDGLQMLKHVRQTWPDIQILLLSSHEELSTVHNALRIGIAGFVSKVGSEFPNLPHIIQTIASGERYIDARISAAMVNYWLANPTSRIDRNIQMSPRENEVIRLFLSGMSVSEIARHTNRSLKTISTQKTSVMRKLGASNDIELLDALRS